MNENGKVVASSKQGRVDRRARAEVSFLGSPVQPEMKGVVLSDRRGRAGRSQVGGIFLGKFPVFLQSSATLFIGFLCLFEFSNFPNRINGIHLDKP